MRVVSAPKTGQKEIVRIEAIRTISKKNKEEKLAKEEKEKSPMKKKEKTVTREASHPKEKTLSEAGDISIPTTLKRFYTFGLLPLVTLFE